MKTLLQSLAVAIALLFATNRLSAQVENNDVFLGLGFGLDYGGIGAKLEYLPSKYFDLFGGVGYNLASVGVNGGFAVKLMPDAKACLNLLAMYGYNGVLIIKGINDDSSTSYGPTFGTSLDISVSKRRHKISIGLFVPVRSSKFMDEYDAVKGSLDNKLWPVAFSVGFNFNLCTGDKNGWKDPIYEQYHRL